MASHHHRTWTVISLVASSVIVLIYIFTSTSDIHIPVFQAWADASSSSSSTSASNNQRQQQQHNQMHVEEKDEAKDTADSAKSWWSDMEFEPFNNAADNSDNEDLQASMENPDFHLDQRPLLQVPCSITQQQQQLQQHPGLPITTMIDTSLTVSTITMSAVQRLKRDHQHNDGKQPWNVHFDATQHRWYLSVYLPQQNRAFIWLRMMDAALPIDRLEIIMDDDSRVMHNVDGTKMDLRLGIDFLQPNNAVINFQNSELELKPPRQLEQHQQQQQHKYHGEDTAATYSIPFVRPRVVPGLTETQQPSNEEDQDL